MRDRSIVCAMQSSILAHESAITASGNRDPPGQTRQTDRPTDRSTCGPSRHTTQPEPASCSLCVKQAGVLCSGVGLKDKRCVYFWSYYSYGESYGGKEDISA